MSLVGNCSHTFSHAVANRSGPWGKSPWKRTAQIGWPLLANSVLCAFLILLIYYNPSVVKSNKNNNFLKIPELNEFSSQSSDFSAPTSIYCMFFKNHKIGCSRHYCTFSPLTWGHYAHLKCMFPAHGQFYTLYLDLSDLGGKWRTKNWIEGCSLTQLDPQPFGKFLVFIIIFNLDHLTSLEVEIFLPLVTYGSWDYWHAPMSSVFKFMCLLCIFQGLVCKLLQDK